MLLELKELVLRELVLKELKLRELELFELKLVEFCVLTELAVLAVLKLRELSELAVLAVLAVLTLLVLWLLQLLLLPELSLCEVSEEAVRALMEECEELSVERLDIEVLESVSDPKISLMAVSTSVIKVVRFVPYLAMSSAVKYSGYSTLIASIRRLRSLKDRA